MELQAGTKVGEYEVTGRLGAGAMGIVYSGVHPLIGKKVAIKVLDPHYANDQDAVDGFLNEARVVNEIGHPNIVDIFSFGLTADGAPYLVMELLEGMSLGALLSKQPRLPLPQVVALLRPVAEAVHLAHSRGIIHRGLKPDNIFITRVPGGTHGVKVLDFGAAKLLSAPTPTTGLRGTEETSLYMAPEQCLGETIDHRADVYAFGVVAYHASTGQFPWDAPLLTDLVSLHQHKTPPAPPSTRGAPIETDGPLLRCLRHDPEERYDSLQEAHAALASSLREPIRTNEAFAATEMIFVGQPLPSEADDKPAPKPTGLPLRAPDTEIDTAPSTALDSTRAHTATAIKPRTSSELWRGQGFLGDTVVITVVLLSLLVVGFFFFFLYDRYVRTSDGSREPAVSDLQDAGGAQSSNQEVVSTTDPTPAPVANAATAADASAATPDADAAITRKQEHDTAR